MHCGGRGGGGGPTAIVHVLPWTKGSSGSVCKPTAGFSPLTRPHAGQNITERLPWSRPCSGSVFNWSPSEGRIVSVRRVQPTAVQRASPSLRTERTHGPSARICKHQFFWPDFFAGKRVAFPRTHTHSEPPSQLLEVGTGAPGPPRRDFLLLCRCFRVERGFNAKALARRLTGY